MEPMHLAISGGKKVKCGSHSGPILEMMTQPIQKRSAAILVSESESKAVRVEAITGAYGPRTSSAASLTLSTLVFGAEV